MAAHAKPHPVEGRASHAIVEYESTAPERSTAVTCSFGAVKKLVDRIPARLRNRYGVVAALMLAWVTLFADNDLWTLWKNHRALSEMRNQREWYTREIARTREQLTEIASDKELLEKFARERYLMKRDNEDIFVLVAEK